MAGPPAKKSRESNTISLVVGKWEKNQVEQISPIHRIGGFPWRLLIRNEKSYQDAWLLCEKSSEAELWKCSATVVIDSTNKRFPMRKQTTVTFQSWSTQKWRIGSGKVPEGALVKMSITTDYEEKIWNLRPCLDTLAPRDGILVIGKEQEKFHVNKESLASQSPFFERLFYGDFKEQNMDEIPVKEVEYEEFANVIGMVYNYNDASLTDENVNRVAQLADQFEIKIVSDRVITYLLSSSSTLSLAQKILIADMYNLPFLMEYLLLRSYTREQVKEMSQSAEWEQLSARTLRLLFKKFCF